MKTFAPLSNSHGLFHII